MSTTDWQQDHVETGLYPPVTYLLIDDLHIRRMEGVRRVACPPQKHPEPVVKPEKPWEGEGVWMHNGWLYDDEEQVFKLWYHSLNTCSSSRPAVRSRSQASSSALAPIRTPSPTTGRARHHLSGRAG